MTHLSPTRLLDSFARTAVDADMCAEVINELHSSHQVTRLEQRVKCGVQRLVKGDGTLGKDSQLFLRTKHTVGTEHSSRQHNPAALCPTVAAVLVKTHTMP